MRENGSVAGLTERHLLVFLVTAFIVGVHLFKKWRTPHIAKKSAATVQTG